MASRFVALCCLPAAVFGADIDVTGIPVVPWLQSQRVPLAGSTLDSAPTCFDLNGDGDKDCFVGSQSGLIEYWDNQGTASAFSYIRNTAKDIAAPTGVQYTKPCAGDFDGDGNMDLLVGGHTGLVAFYKGNADRTFTLGEIDVFGLATKTYEKSSASPGILRATFGSGLGGGSGSAVGLLASLAVSGLVSVAVGTLVPMVPGLGAMAAKAAPLFVLDTYSAPSCADLDGDGDLDCLVGFNSGSVALFENVGTPLAALWRLTTPDLFAAAVFMPLARRAAPFLYDWDMDKDFDALVGFEDGAVAYYLDQQHVASKLPTGSNYVSQSADVFSSAGKAGHSHAALWCGHTDNDGYPECVVGSATGPTFAYDTDLPDPTARPTATPSPTIPPTKKPVPTPTRRPTPPPTTLESMAGGGGGGASAASSTGLIIGIVFAIAAVLGVVACMGYKKQLDDRKALRRSTFNNSHGGSASTGVSGGGGVELDAKTSKGSLSTFGEPGTTAVIKTTAGQAANLQPNMGVSRSTLAPPSPQVAAPVRAQAQTQVIYPTEGVSYGGGSVGVASVGVASVGWAPNPAASAASAAPPLAYSAFETPEARKQREFEAANGFQAQQAQQATYVQQADMNEAILASPASPAEGDAYMANLAAAAAASAAGANKV